MGKKYSQDRIAKLTMATFISLKRQHPTIRAGKQRKPQHRAVEADSKVFEEEQTASFDFSQCPTTDSSQVTPFKLDHIDTSQLNNKAGAKTTEVKSGRLHRCKFVSLFELEKHCYKKFKMFSEQDVPFTASALTVVPLDDPVHDDDYQTDNDQITSSLTSLNSGLARAAKDFLKGKCVVSNLERVPKPL